MDVIVQGMKKKIKSKIANYLFLREFGAHNRQHKVMSFMQARTIGIIYNSTHEKDFETIKRYVKELREVHKKDVLALGYYDKKELPHDRFSKLGLDFFTRKSLNWHFRPIAPIVKNFMDKDFDVLIDLHTGNSSPFRYVIAMTKAKFKIGRYDRISGAFYDFMISVDPSITLPVFIQQINHYLNMINHEQTYQ